MRILIVDDDSSLIEIVSVVISKRFPEHDFVLRENGEEGLNTFHKEHIDLVITDYHMPVMDGIELTKELRKESGLPILMYSSTPNLEDKLEGVGVTKLFDKQDLDSLLDCVQSFSTKLI